MILDPEGLADGKYRYQIARRPSKLWKSDLIGVLGSWVVLEVCLDFPFGDIDRVPKLQRGSLLETLAPRTGLTTRSVERSAKSFTENVLGDPDLVWRTQRDAWRTRSRLHVKMIILRSHFRFPHSVRCGLSPEIKALGVMRL